MNRSRNWSRTALSGRAIDPQAVSLFGRHVDRQRSAFLAYRRAANPALHLTAAMRETDGSLRLVPPFIAETSDLTADLGLDDFRPGIGQPPPNLSADGARCQYVGPSGTGLELPSVVRAGAV